MQTLQGPRGTIEYERDALGYPRVRARDRLDGAFARGWFHAVDRLVQIELSLAIARGRFMAVLGDVPIARAMDQATGMFGFGADLEQQVAKMAPETRAPLEAYCAGFEAGAAMRGRPLVLRLLGIERQPYTVASMVLVYRLISYFGLTSLALWSEMLVGELVATGAEGRLLELLAGPAGRIGAPCPLATLKWPAELRQIGPTPAYGSNGFAVAARRSSTGGALLMAEPHMEVARFPPILYAMHVDYPDGDYLQGVGVPGLGWLSFGRTQDVAWTYTYGHGDCVDILVERCHKERYLAAGDWRPLARRVVDVAVKGRSKPERLTFWDNDFGTVVGDAGSDEPIDLPCLRWSGFREVWSDFDACLRVQLSRDVTEAHRGIKAISLHAVLADARGSVAYAQTGQIDVRPEGWSGALPWPGWHLSERGPYAAPESSRPLTIDPPEGCVVSANEARSGPDGTPWSSFPEPPYRYQRLNELLAGSGKLGMNDLARASYDSVDLCARRLLAAWAALLPDEAEAKDLCAWAKTQTDRGADHLRRMGLFHSLYREVIVELLGRFVGEEQGRKLVEVMIADVCFGHHLDDALALERPHLLDEPELREVLARAWSRAQTRIARGDVLVPVRDKFKNVITQGKIPLLGFDSSPVTFPGGPTTPFQSRVVDFLGQRIVSAPSCHYLTDMSKRGGWYNLPGGASERRFGPGYGRGVREWSEGDFLPLGDPEGLAPSARAPSEESTAP